MLTHLYIQNYIIIEQMELTFNQGLTVITGETGAGKSIVIDALMLALGERADNSVIGNFQNKCDLSVCFTIDTVINAKAWLQERNYLDDDSNECIIRRVLQKDGKSRQTINGHPCTRQELRELVPLLIEIHSQKQQQAIVKRHDQLNLLDQFCGHLHLCDQVKSEFTTWQDHEKQLQRLQQTQQNYAVQKELLQFQIDEFIKLDLQTGEYEQLDQEHKFLANAHQLVSQCENVLQCLSESEQHNAQSILHRAQQSLQNLTQFHEKIAVTHELISQAALNINEATSELRGFLSHTDINPQRLESVERRLTKIHDVARKYQLPPAELVSQQQTLQNQLDALDQTQQQIVHLTAQLQPLHQRYVATAKLLHTKRVTGAQTLNAVITNSIQKLGMPGGNFTIDLAWNESEPTSLGCDKIEFLVSTNPGQPLQSLAKVASGGEMSRIALAIYVATAQNNTTPNLVFDEVDVGIGGSTAAIVGELLKSLGNSAQILCITHLPQVASYGDHHLCVQKQVTDNTTSTQINALSAEERIHEIARMLGGLSITQKTLAHAKELLSGQTL